MNKEDKNEPQLQTLCSFAWCGVRSETQIWSPSASTGDHGARACQLWGLTDPETTQTQEQRMELGEVNADTGQDGAEAELTDDTEAQEWAQP